MQIITKQYFHTETTETRWDPPDASSSTGDDEEAAVVELWAPVLDPASQRTYYVNQSTGEASWMEPESGWLEKTDEGSGRK